ncbi:MAG TPA: hypothetical protein VFF88_01395, partial [Methylocella sp.]|nr:hypothetical protein [Methylocella sp.]
MARRKSFSLLMIVLLAAPSLAHAGGMPKRIGQCVETRIKEVGTRLTDGATGKPVPGSGSAVSFVNGGYQVSYDTVPAIEQSKAGDPVRICLVAIPKNCPKGDGRGRQYKTTNLRMQKVWT